MIDYLTTKYFSYNNVNEYIMDEGEHKKNII